MEITAESMQKLRDALSLNFNYYVNFESRHAIDKMFNKGDVVSVVGVPEVRGVVKRVVLCDSRSDSVAFVSGIPDFSAIVFCALEHAPDDDGVTRYHTETGEVFAECGTSDKFQGDASDRSDRRQRFLENTLDEIARDFPVVLHGGEASGKSDSIANILNLLECYRLSKQGKTGDDAKVRAELESPPMRKFRGEVYAAGNYGTGPAEFEFEVPATATAEEIESAANMAAMDEVQVSWSEVHPPKPRKKKGKTD